MKLERNDVLTDTNGDIYVAKSNWPRHGDMGILEFKRRDYACVWRLKNFRKIGVL